MLRALFEIEREARPGAGHERRGAERRDGGPRPDPGRDRAADRALARRHARPGRSPTARSGRYAGPCRAAPTSTPPRSCRRGWSRSSGTRRSRSCRSGSRCARPASSAPPSTGSPPGHWSTAIMASAAVPGLLPPAEVGDEHFLDGGIVNSIPLGRAVMLGRRPRLRAPGRPDRPAADSRRKRPWEVARVSFEIARRHRFARELAEAPDGVEAHVLPARGTSAAGRLAARPPRLLARRAPGSTRPTTPARSTSTMPTGPAVTWLLAAAGDRARRDPAGGAAVGAPSRCG